jgi:hypothetical protein
LLGVLALAGEGSGYSGILVAFLGTGLIGLAALPLAVGAVRAILTEPGIASSRWMRAGIMVGGAAFHAWWFTSWIAATGPSAFDVDLGPSIGGLLIAATLAFLPAWGLGLLAVALVPWRHRRGAWVYPGAVGLVVLAVTLGAVLSPEVPGVRVTYVDPYVVESPDVTITIGWAGQASGEFVVRLGDDCSRGALLGHGKYDRGTEREPASEFVIFSASRLAPGINRVMICLTVGGNTGSTGPEITRSD